VRDRPGYPGGYNACLVLAAHLYDPERSERYPSTKGQLARDGARLWPLADRELLEQFRKQEDNEMSFKNNVGKKAVEPTAAQCEMVDVHHPDCGCESCKMMLDVQCLEPCVGVVPESGNTRVCGACAAQQEREGFAVAYHEGTRFVIVHPELGVYIGCDATGMVDYWSRVNPGRQPAAITFPDRAAAVQAMSSWRPGQLKGAEPWPVVADYKVVHGDRPTFATVDACERAGLPRWDPQQYRATTSPAP